MSMTPCGAYEDARACFDKAIEINPTFATPHWNRSLLNLKYGNLLDGWRDYEWRWNTEVLSCYAERRDLQAAAVERPAIARRQNHPRCTPSRAWATRSSSAATRRW